MTFLLIGVGIGAATALLLAPKTGKQMRNDLRRGYDDAREKISDLSDDARESLRERVGDVRDRFGDIHETVREKVGDAMDRGAEIADAVREKVCATRQSAAPLIAHPLSDKN